MSVLMSVGYDNYINTGKVVAVTRNNSAPIKRLIKEARDKGVLIDVTEGARTCSVVIMDGGYVVLTPRTPSTIQKRFNG